MNEPRMPALLVEHHRPGFYFRVLQEGEVGAGDDIVKTTDGPERISVADIDALLYLPGHTREQLQRALRIPALAKGWQGSFQAMLEQDSSPKTAAGNPGLAYEEQPPAWPGFRPMRVANISKESDSVTSLRSGAKRRAASSCLPGGSIRCFAAASRRRKTAGSSQLFAV